MLVTSNGGPYFASFTAAAIASHARDTMALSGSTPGATRTWS